MFTGIVEEKGVIESIRSGGGYYRLTVRCSKVLGRSQASSTSGQSSSNSGHNGQGTRNHEGFDGYEVPTEIGDSIAVNGICLTVTDLTESSFTADVMPETISRTSLAGAKPGTEVDLERAMPAYGRFGGHIVSGHIDGTGKITEIRKDGNAVWYTIAADSGIMRLIVEKGSVAIDGISLTVARVSGGTFSVSVIPHTIEETILPDRRAGSLVNLETDVVGKYVSRLLAEDGSMGDKEDNITRSDARLMDLISRG